MNFKSVAAGLSDISHIGHANHPIAFHVDGNGGALGRYGGMQISLSGDQRFSELDGLRGLAALGVVVYHFGMACGRVWPAVLGPFYERGLLLVDLFFALSGFVLTHAFDRPQRRRQIVANTLNRIRRLYPLHALTLVVTAGLWLCFGDRLAEHNAFGSINDGYHFLLNGLLLQASGLESGFSFNTPAWSIGTEFLVNVAWFAALMLPKRLSLIGLSALTAVCACLLQRHGLTNISKLDGWLNVSLLRTALGFLSGMWAYKLYARYPRRQQGSLLADGAAVMLIICTLCVFEGWGLFGRHPRTLLTFWSLVGFPALLLSIMHSRWLRRGLKRPAIAWLGASSFALYLTHLLVLYGLMLVVPVTQWYTPITLMGFIVVSLAIAGVVSRYVERPIDRYLRSDGRFRFFQHSYDEAALSK